ncbi:cytosine deaminase [Rhizocola hellebori]|uniref:Cytosine deaminase n=1 Tax=Rhizocola hellebori TaxID=1392758 RepID=A0A8J3VHM7_9ACTN|nr:amidohydrolase family protein [Rhizocola hellebori]GIH06432.1 cytosine deaminase [Rhizocola hellebori]
MSASGTLLLRGVTLEDGRHTNVLLRGNVIEAVGAQAGDETLDLEGYLLLPAPAEAHAHLDKAYTADVVPNPAGDLMGAVEGWLRHRPTLTAQDITDRATAALRAYLAHGATAVRSHVDIGEGIGLRALEAVVALKTPVTPQIVAFAGTPLSGVDGAQNRAMLRDAMAAGAHAVGACPGLDPDPKACIEFCLELAQAHLVPTDMHVDEWLDPDPCALALLAEIVLASSFEQQVTASHCVSLGMMPAAQARAIAETVAQAGIGVVCLPQTNLYLQGRQHDFAPPRGLTALSVLRQAGVVVAAGGDNLQDPFNPMGRADPLETAALLVVAGHHSPQQAYAAVSDHARHVLGLPAVTISPGSPAELLAIRAGSLREALATTHPERLVISAGRVVARTSIQREWPTC